MKNLFKRTLALILAMLTVFSIGFAVNAAEVNHGWWTFDEETGHLTVLYDIPSYQRPAQSEWFGLRTKTKSVSFANGVKSIGNRAFQGFTEIESVQLPITLERIGEFAFASCGKLADIELPGSLKTIADNAFTGCKSLTELEIPAKAYIDYGAFSGCKALKKLVIYSSTTSINSLAFNHCDNLEVLEIPEGIRINSNAFDRCLNINKVYYTGTKESYNEMPVVSSVNNSLSYATVYYNQPAKIYPVAISVGTMPEKTEYEIGEKVDLTGFELALSMSDGSIQHLSDLSKMYIHDFDSSSKGERNIVVEYYGYTTKIPYTVVEDPNGTCGSNMYWVLDDNGVLTISGSGKMNNFTGYRSSPWSEYKDIIKAVKVENGVESIGANAFCNCTSLTEIHLPESIKSIENQIFKDSGLKDIYYSGTVEDWNEISSTKNEYREMNLYFNGELHEHSYENKTVMNEATCTHPGRFSCVCECGCSIYETIARLEHTPGEWETDDSGATVKKCTVCARTLEVKEESSEETTEPEEAPQEPEIEEPVSDETVEEENGIIDIIEDVIGKITDIVSSIFNKIAGLFIF